jgi:hypothetical protein
MLTSQRARERTCRDWGGSLVLPRMASAVRRFGDSLRGKLVLLNLEVQGSRRSRCDWAASCDSPPGIRTAVPFISTLVLKFPVWEVR